MAISSTLLKSFQLSTLTTALALAGCGGGGNDTLQPAYNPTKTVTNSSTSNDATVTANLAKVTKVAIVSDNSSFYMNNGETITLTAYALDKNNLGVAGVPVEVTIPDPTKTGVYSSTPAALVTDASGKATITLDVKSLTDAQKTELRKGVTITAKVGSQTASKTLTGSDTKTSTTPVNSVTVDASNSIITTTNTTIPAQLGAKVTVTAIAVDKNGNIIPNKAVVFNLQDKSADTGLFPNGSSTVTTNDKGEAALELEIKSLSDAQKAYLLSTGVTITASADGSTLSGSVTIKGVEGATSGAKFDVQKVSLTTPTTTFNTKVGEKFTVTASVLNSNNTGLGGVPVQFKLADDPSMTGVYSVSDLSNVVTNANGEATIELEVKSDAFKDYLITKGINIQATAKNTIGTTPIDKTGSLNIKGNAVTTVATNISKVDKVLLSPNPSQFDLTTGTQISVTANVTDTATGALSDVPVTFTLPSLEQTGIANLSGSTVTTNTNGEATINLQLKSLTAAQRDYLIKNGLTVNASTPNGKIATAINIAAKNTVIDSAVNSVSVVADSDNLLMAVGSTVKVTAIALDKDFGGIANTDLKFTLPDPTTTGVFNITGSTIKTDSKGEAIITLQVKSTLTAAQKQALANGLIVNVTAPNGKTGQIKLSAKAVNDVVANTVNLTSNVNNIPLTVGSQFTVTANVSDAQNGAIANAPVTFNLPAFASFGVGSLSPSTVITNAQGQATITLQVQSLTDAQKQALLNGFTINATSNGKTATALTLKGIDPIKRFDVKSIRMSTPISKFNVKTGERFTVTASVLNGNNTGIAGAPVEFKLDDPALTGVYAVSDTTNVITNANGEATIELEVKSEAQKQALLNGGVNIIATAKNTMSNTPSDVSETLTVLGIDPITNSNIAKVSKGLLVASVNPFDLTVGTKFTVTASITDTNSGKLDGVPVTFALPDLDQTGIANLSGSTVITNANGEATINVEIKSLSAAQRDYLLNNGLVINATVPNGTKITPLTLSAKNVITADNAIEAVSVTADSNNIIMAAGSRVKVTAVALDKNFGGIAGQTLTVNLPNPDVTGVYNLSGSTVTTDEKGEAIIELEVKAPLTDAQKSALVNGLNLSVTAANGRQGVINLAAKAANEVSVSTVTLTGSSIPLTIGAQVKVTATVLDNQKGIVKNAPITFYLPSFDDTGVASLSPSTVLTDDKGEAVITLEVKSLTAAQKQALLNGFIINATSNGKTATALTLKGIKEASVADIAKVNLVTNVNSLPTNTGDTINVTAQVRDNNDTSLANMPVSFELLDPTNATGITATTPLQATTNANGEAVLTLKVGTLTPDQKYYLQTSGLSFRATAGTVTSSIVTLRTQEAIIANSVNTLLLTSDSAVQMAVGSKVKVTALAIDKNGAVVPNAQVSFKVPTDSGLVNNTGAVLATDANGQASIELELKSLTDTQRVALQNGVSIYAQSGTSAGTTTVQGATSNANIEAYKLFVSPSKTTLRTATDTATLGIKVTDTNGGIKAGVPVQLQILEGLDKGITLSTASNLVTDENGYVQVDLTQNDIGLISKLDHTAKVRVIVNDGVYQQTEQTLDFTVAGTTIKDGFISKSVITDNASDTVTVSGVAVDGNNKPIANQSIQLLSDGAALTVPAVMTDATGKFTFTVTSEQLGNAVNSTINLQARITDANATLVSQPYNLGSLTKITATNLSLSIQQNGQTATSNEVKVDTPATVMVDLPSSVADGTTIYLTTNKGSFGLNGPSRIAATSQNGKAVFNNIISTSPGTAILTVDYNGAKQLEQSITFITDKVAKVLLQIVNTTVSVNGVTQVIASVRDINDAPVKNALVEFSSIQDASGGKLSSGSVLTDDSGNAIVSYYAGTTPTPVNGVQIQAAVNSVKLGNTYLPVSGIQTQFASFTVQNLAAWIGFAFADKVGQSDDKIYYIRNGSIFINNSIGQPAANQDVSIAVIPRTFGVGLWKHIPATADTPAKWATQSFTNGNTNAGIYHCLSEDFNNNATLDNGEDYTGDNLLTPLNPITVLSPNGTQILSTQTLKTDSTGKLDFSIRYGKEYAQWMTATVRVTTKVDGSEFSQVRDISLPVVNTDIDTNQGIRPNLISPFGTLATSTMLPYCFFVPSSN